MTVNEVLGGLGSWSIKLREDTPDDKLKALGFFGHVAVIRGRVDVDATGASLLGAARYVGVLRERSKDRRQLEGDGMIFWLGDEDDKGRILETPVNLNGASLTTAVNAVLPPTVHAGTINTAAGVYTGKHQFETPRKALDKIVAAFGVEYRVNGDATLDVGTQAQLYRTSPVVIIAAKNVGSDMDLTSLGANFDVDESARDYSSRILLFGQTTGDDAAPFVSASATAPVLPYADMFGNPVQVTRTVSQSGTGESSALAVANLNLNRFNRVGVALKVTATDYAISGPFKVGDNAYVYDPANGIYDTTRTIDFRGEKIHPDVVRISGATWPVTDEHTVAFRTQAGAWVDLTPWVVWESGGGEITVGDLPKSLTGNDGVPITDRVDSLPDTSIPTAPANLDLATFAVTDSRGGLSAVIRVEWDAPTLNTDGTVITDLASYSVAYKRTNVAGDVWQYAPSADTSLDLEGLVIDEDYTVKVAAVDRANHTSAYTAELGIHTAVDNIAPPAPSDPVVTNYLGQLRIAWDGKNNVGAAMPPDFNRTDVHVSSTSGFTPSTSTLVASLSTAGVAYATAPYATTRYVKLIAYDTAGNASAPSGQGSGATTQVVSADIFNGAVGSTKLADLAVITAKINDLAVNNAKIGDMEVGKLTAGTMSADVVLGGRFATALTLARVELNALGLQKWNSSNQLMVSITGTTNLLTGQVQTALSGTRMVMNPGGAQPDRIDFYPSSGAQFASVEAETVAGQGAVTISANNATPTGLSGVVLVRRSFAHLFFGAKDLSTIVSELYADSGTVRMTSKICDVVVKDDPTTPGGSRFAMTMQGNLNTQVNYWATAVGEPWLSGVNQDAGIVLSGRVPAGSNARVYIVGSNYLNRRDLFVSSVLYEGSLIPTSSEKIKDSIAEVTDVDIRAATRVGKAKRYKIKDRAEAEVRDKAGKVTRPAREAPMQMGLIAEELPQAVQTLIPNAINGQDVLGYDLNALVALAWTGLGQAFDDIEALRGQIAALNGKDKLK